MSLFVLAGLGNPGSRYASNRHNIGFMAIDAIAAAYDFPPFKTRFNALVAEGVINAHKVLLCKPVTFMNRSGQAVGELLRFYKISLQQLYVIHDDLDLPPGRIKFKSGGGSGGHNGLASLDQHIGKDYWRVRLGIGHPGRSEDQSPSHRDAVSTYVLSDFSHHEKESVTYMLAAIVREAGTLFGSDPGIWLTRIAQNLK